MAVNRGNDWLIMLKSLQQNVGERGGCYPATMRCADAFINVGSRAEGPAGTGDDPHPGGIVGVEVVDGLQQLGHELQIHGVQLVWSLQSNLGYPVLAVI